MSKDKDFIELLITHVDWMKLWDITPEGKSMAEVAEEALHKFLATHHAFPKVVCLCGSTRFGDAFAKANFDETLEGNIVLTIGCNTKSDAELFAGWGEREIQALKEQLDELHKRKIDLADEILVLNVGGYIGDSTRSEIEYARTHGKNIRWLEPCVSSI